MAPNENLQPPVLEEKIASTSTSAISPAIVDSQHDETSLPSASIRPPSPLGGSVTGHSVTQPPGSSSGQTSLPAYRLPHEDLDMDESREHRLMAHINILLSENARLAANQVEPPAYNQDS